MTLPSNHHETSLPADGNHQSHASYHARGSRATGSVQFGTNQAAMGMQGFRRSGHVHDEGECQMSIAEFMAEQGLPRDRDDV
jgi:hypothetical protein